MDLFQLGLGIAITGWGVRGLPQTGITGTIAIIVGGVIMIVAALT